MTISNEDLLHGATILTLLEEIDEIDRRILQFQMEKLSLARESDDASKERLERIEFELEELLIQINQKFI